MTYKEAVEACNDLRTRFDRPFASVDKATIEQLYREVLDKEFRPTNCNQCYHDALIEVYLYLKKEKKMKEKCKYRLRAGFIISCPNFMGGRIFSNDNLTDNVAAEYLKMFPQNEYMFQRLPAKVEEPVTPDPATEEKAEETAPEANADAKETVNKKSKK